MYKNRLSPFVVFILLSQLTTFVKPDCVHGYYYSHVSRCSSFYQCSHGTLVELTCPAGLHFNTRINNCDDPARALCEISTDTTTTDDPASTIYQSESTAVETTDETASVEDTTENITTEYEATTDKEYSTTARLLELLELLQNEQMLLNDYIVQLLDLLRNIGQLDDAN